jgi:iron complex outermembrane receptor protein
VLRADGSLEFAEGMMSIDFGLRWSQREMNEDRADYFSPSGIDGLYQKYSEAGYALGQAGAPGGTAFGLEYDPLPFYGLDSPELAAYVTTVTNFGEVDGLNVALPMIDTRAIGDSPEAWRDMLYGEGVYLNAPDRSYSVIEDQLAGYLKVNLDVPITDFVRMSGNVGVRVVSTEIEVTQNVTNPLQLRQDILAGVDPNHSNYIDLGDLVTTTERTRALPSVNLNFDFGDTWRLKAAYYETQALQPLPNLGQGEITYYQTEQQCQVLGPECVDVGGGVLREPFQRVSNINRSGNPELEPWHTRTFSGAVEWYPRDNAIVSLGVFHADVESYTYNRVTTDTTVADSDGVVRNGASVNTISNGLGASYYGFEFGYQQSFDFLPGLLGNTGATFNWTYSPSQGGQDAATGDTIVLATGEEAPFNNTAENQFNVILFYQDERFQARVAANYLGESYQGSFNHWAVSPTTGTSGFGNFQESTLYVDASAAFDISEQFQIYVQGQNLTEEAPVNYTGWSNFRLNYNQFESVYTVGVRARF